MIKIRYWFGITYTFLSYSIIVCLVLPHNSFTGSSITLCFQMHLLLPLAHQRLRPQGLWIYWKLNVGLTGHGTSRKGICPLQLYFVPWHNTENFVGTTLKVKLSKLSAVFHFLVTSAILLWLITSTSSKAIFLSSLQYMHGHWKSACGKKWGRWTPTQIWVIPITSQSPTSLPAFRCMWTQA